MRRVNASAQTQREKRESLIEIPMVWIEARNRDNNNKEGMGFWRGDDTLQIIVRDMFTGNNVARTFYNVGLIGISSIRFESGLNIRPITITMAGNSAGVDEILRLYEPRGAPTQIWKRSYNPLTREPVGVEPVYCGFIDNITIRRPTPGGEATAEVELVSITRTLTITSSLKKSHQVQKKREGDQIRRYKAVASKWDIPWGAHDR